MPLEDFVEETYELLRSKIEVMPDRTQFMLPFMIKGNWLLGYRELNGLRRSLSGMSKRSRFKSNMEHATTDLELDYEQYKLEFQAFFPEVIKFTRTCI
jgi:acyl carrier protein phosphodiesterase